MSANRLVSDPARMPLRLASNQIKPLREAGGAPSTRKSRSITSTPASGTAINVDPLSCTASATSVMLVAPAGVVMTTR